MKNQGLLIIRPTERGNALVIILVLIALLAALTMTLTRTSSKTSSNLSNDNYRIAAEKVMRQSQSFAMAVDKLRNVNRCSENEISFENTGGSARAYANASAPTDKRCHVFDMAGGGLLYAKPDSGVLDTAASAKSDYGDWVFYANQCVLQVGSGDTPPCTVAQLELMVVLPHIQKEVCMEINQLSGITNQASDAPEEAFDESGTGFDGTYTLSGSDPEIGEGASGVNLVGHASGCFKQNAGTWMGSYIFYGVLIPR